jgi:hypothetical protein
MSVREPLKQTLARQLFVLMEGICISSRFFGADNPAADVVVAARALIDLHRQSNRKRTSFDDDITGSSY